VKTARLQPKSYYHSEFITLLIAVAEPILQFIPQKQQFIPQFFSGDFLL